MVVNNKNKYIFSAAASQIISGYSKVILLQHIPRTHLVRFGSYIPASKWLCPFCRELVSKVLIRETVTFVDSGTIVLHVLCPFH